MWLPAFAVPARIARDDWSRHLMARLGASILAAIALIAVPHVLPALARWTDAACLVRGLTGWPCPGCGITTSLLALGRGDIVASWAANPAGFGVAGLLLGQAILATAALRSGRTGAPGSRGSGAWTGSPSVDCWRPGSAVSCGPCHSAGGRVATVSCPKCGSLTSQGGFPAWVIIVAICFFPVGLLALLAGRKPTQCGNCGTIWQA